MIKGIIAYLYYLFYRYIKKDIFKSNIGRWFWHQGDNTLLINYPLTNKSIVFDIGGYIGIFSEKIYNKYHPELYIFEPIEEFYKQLKVKFNDNKNVNVYEFGLSNVSEERMISLNGERSSTEISIGSKMGNKTARFVDIIEFMENNNIKNIDLLSMNIEGGEYAILERLISSGRISIIKNLQVQFHIIDGNSFNNRKEIIRKLMKTHKVNFEYPFVWDSFVLK